MNEYEIQRKSSKIETTWKQKKLIRFFVEEHVVHNRYSAAILTSQSVLHYTASLFLSFPFLLFFPSYCQLAVWWGRWGRSFDSLEWQDEREREEREGNLSVSILQFNSYSSVFLKAFQHFSVGVASHMHTSHTHWLVVYFFLQSASLFAIYHIRKISSFIYLSMMLNIKNETLVTNDEMFLSILPRLRSCSTSSSLSGNSHNHWSTRPIASWSAHCCSDQGFDQTFWIFINEK